MFTWEEANRLDSSRAMQLLTALVMARMPDSFLSRASAHALSEP